MDSYVLDTSALITLRDDEEGADQVATILQKGQRGTVVMASFMSFMEVFYCVWRASGKAAALKAHLELKMLPLQKIEMDEELLLLAGELKATAPLSVADSWIAATALQKKAKLVHKDPEFEPLSPRISLIALPYKSNGCHRP